MAKKRPSRKKPGSARTTVRRAKKTTATQPRTKPDEGLDSDIISGESDRYTGRMIATVLDTDKNAIKSVLKTLSNTTGMSASSSQVAFSGSDSDAQELPDDVNYQVLESLGIVVLNNPQIDQMATNQITPQDHNVVMEPEMWNYQLGSETSLESTALSTTTDQAFSNNIELSSEYLMGMRDAIDLILQRRSSQALSTAAGSAADDSSEHTWGIRTIGVADSTLSGAGIRVAVLDSGFDISHPDFAGRSVTAESFIPNSQPDNDQLDRTGHGTHCIGTACGPLRPAIGPRYGIAYNAEIFSAKVLRKPPNRKHASGQDGWILQGIDWAIRNKCQVISLSLGLTVTSSTFPQFYEKSAKTGLAQGSLIIAAAGNSSRRSRGIVKPVGRPANCPSILSVAALDKNLTVADFSNAMKFNNGGEVNLAGPGVDILSSAPMPKRRAVFNGTSMATPHVAGLAALICEQTGKTGMDLYREMRDRAMQLGSESDLGHGLARISAVHV